MFLHCVFVDDTRHSHLLNIFSLFPLFSRGRCIYSFISCVFLMSFLPGIRSVSYLLSIFKDSSPLHWSDTHISHALFFEQTAGVLHADGPAWLVIIT